MNLRHPFGSTVGAPGDREQQQQVLRAALAMLAEATLPGSMARLDSH